MEATQFPLFSDAERRRIPSSPSSNSSFGFAKSGIFKLGLTDGDQVVSGITSASTRSIEERSFDALVAAKVWTSKVAMHLSLDARDRYFRQLDRLHDADEWVEGNPVGLESYKGFIRFMLLAGRSSKPALGLSPTGCLVAVWMTKASRLTLEFLDKDHAEWLVRLEDGAEVERAAGKTTVTRLPAVLAPFKAEEWFGLGK